MGIIKNIRSIFPLPKGWENDSDRKAFGIRIEQTLRDLFARISRCVTFTKPTAETTLTSDQKAQARSNIGCGDASTYGVKNNLTTTSSGYVLDARQGKVLNDAKAEDDEVVHLAGAETITGNKTFTVAGGIYIQPNNRYKYAQFKQYGSEKTVAGIRTDSGNATNITKSQIAFFEYSPNATPNTETTWNYELYLLPEATSGRTANVNYDILTTKAAVTVAQGGTGATSAADARTNLGLGAAATQAVKNNLTTTASGSVLDARQGKVLSDNKAYRLYGVIDHGTTVTLSMECNYGILFIGNTTDYCVAWVYDSVAIKVINVNSSSITLTKSSNSLKIKNSSGSANYRYYLVC